MSAFDLECTTKLSNGYETTRNLADWPQTAAGGKTFSVSCGAVAGATRMGNVPGEFWNFETLRQKTMTITINAEMRKSQTGKSKS